MTDTFVTPRVWTAGERVSAAKMLEISASLNALYPYMAGGDMAYRDPSSDYLVRLAKGSAFQWLGMKSDGTIPQWSSLIYQRQGGNASNWQSPGTTSYTPTAPKIMEGVKTKTINPSGDLTITYPTAFNNRPHVFVTPNCSGGSLVWRVHDDSASGFSVALVDLSTSGSLNVDVNWLAIGE